MDDSLLSSRLKRYAQVSTAMTGLAARVVGERYLGIDINREKHAEGLKTILGGLKGPLMKVAQFLATVPGALPAEYAEELLELQSNAPPMGWSFVRRRMSHELGSQWQSHFKDFTQEAVAAASLGQVHRATLTTGETVACKLQYPDMHSIIEADLQQLRLLFSFYESWNKALQTQNIHQEIEERLKEELDYTSEARNLALFHQIFESHSHIRLPQVYPALSTQRLLTMSWCEGVSLLEKIEAPQEERNDLSKLLFQAWYTPLYHYGLIHGDPHPGNYRLNDKGQLFLLDLGCIRVFKGSFVESIIELYHALESDDKDRMVHAYESWGFKNLTSEAIEIITLWASLLFDPLLDDQVRPIQWDTTGLKGWEMLTKVHEELNKIGGIMPPREFVFMDRAAVGIGSVIMRLRGKQNWHRLFNDLIEGISAEVVDKRQKEIFDRM